MQPDLCSLAGLLGPEKTVLEPDVVMVEVLTLDIQEMEGDRVVVMGVVKKEVQAVMGEGVEEEVEERKELQVAKAMGGLEVSNEGAFLVGAMDGREGAV